jgi:TPR repeat protein
MRPTSMKTLLSLALLIALPVFANEPDSKGLDALRQAADQGNADAQYELGILYEFGYHFPDHKSSAYIWYSRAAEQGSTLAAKRRDALKGQLSASEIERTQAMAKSQTAAPGPTASPTPTTQ